MVLEILAVKMSTFTQTSTELDGTRLLVFETTNSNICFR